MPKYTPSNEDIEERRRKTIEWNKEQAAKGIKFAAQDVEAQREGYINSDSQPNKIGSGGIDSDKIAAAAKGVQAASGGSGMVGSIAGGAAMGSMLTGLGATAATPGAAATAGLSGGASLAIGAGIGAAAGIAGAAANRKAKRAKAQADMHESMIEIEGKKADRIQGALKDMRQAFSSALRIPTNIALGGR